MHYSLHVYVFLVMLYVFKVKSSCIAEENNSHSLRWTGDDANIFLNSITWINDNHPNSADDYIDRCYLVGLVCTSSHPDAYSTNISKGSNLTSTLTIKSVSRLSSQNDGVRWAFVTLKQGNTDKKEYEICDPLVIYAKPEQPTCSTQQLQTLDTKVSMTCVTNKVFPEAECQLYNYEHSDTNPIEAVTAYQHDSYGNPIYFNSTCTIEIELSTMGAGQHQLYVKMFPNVTNGLTVGYKNSNVVSLNLSNPQVEVNSNCFNGPNVMGNFTKTGTTSSCTCTLTNTGNPPGQIQWYRNSTPIGALSNGPTEFIISEENKAAHIYYCKASSALNGQIQTAEFKRKFAYGPDSVNFTGENVFNQCSEEDQNVTVDCHVPKTAVNPKPDFRILSSSDDKLNGKGREKDEGDHFSYSYSFKPNKGGIYTLICEAQNSVFSDLNNTATHKVTVYAPPKSAPIIRITSPEGEIKISDSGVNISAGEPVTISCHVKGGYPPAKVTLNCSSLNKSSVAETITSLESVKFTMEMNNHTCVCSAEHESECYEHSETNVWLSVSAAEVTSDKNISDLDVAAVGGGIAAAVIVIVLIILIICVLKRKGVLWDKENKNELMMHAIPSDDGEEETVTDNDLYAMSRPKSKEIVTKNDIYGTQATPEEVIVNNEIYATGNVPPKDARDYSSFTPSMTSAATLPGNFETTDSAKDNKPDSKESPYSEVSIPSQSTHTKPLVGLKPKPVVQPKNNYNNVKVSVEGAGTGLVIQEDEGNRTYASVIKPSKTGSVRAQPKFPFSSDADIYPDQSKKPDIPEKKFFKDDQDAESEKKEMKGRKIDDIPAAPKAKALAREDTGLPSTSDSNSSFTNNGFTGTEDEANIYANTGAMGDDKNDKDEKDTGRYRNKDGLVYTMVDVPGQSAGEKTARKPRILQEGVNYTMLKFDDK